MANKLREFRAREARRMRVNVGVACALIVKLGMRGFCERFFMLFDTSQIESALKMICFAYDCEYLFGEGKK